jgi:uncharacterized caspase-like protein
VIDYALMIAPKFLSLILAVAVSSLALPACAENSPVGDKWALVVGISKFSDPELNLKYPSKDAKDFADFLIKEAKFAPDHVHLLTDNLATRARILDELGEHWLPFAARPNDLVVIYLSTHGSPSDMDVVGVNYIVAHDTDKDHLLATGIGMQDLCNMVKSRIHSDRTLIIMDACHSGSATNDGGKGLVRGANVDAEAIAQGTGQMVITSSSPSQVSWESKSAPNSVFTKRLIEGFKIKGPDTTVADTFNYVKKKVEEDVLTERGQLQTPVMKTKWEGDDLRLGAPPADPRPSPKIVIAAAPPVRSVETPPVRSVETTPARSDDPAFLAEKALRKHFVRMAYATPLEAYNDFTPAIQKMTPFARYEVNVRKQKYVPAVAHMPNEAFKLVSATSTRATILVNEKWITGQPVLWRYNLINQDGKWLIDNFRIITSAQW